MKQKVFNPDSKEISNIEEKISVIPAKFYNKYKDKEFSVDSPEFVESDFLTDLGEVEDSDTIYLNEGEYHTEENIKISLGNNSNLFMPVFKINKEKHLLVSTLHLMLESQNGITYVKIGNKTIEVTLNGLNVDKELKLNKYEAINTKEGRLNTVEKEDEAIKQTSNNGWHKLALDFEDSTGKVIKDKDIYIYRLDTNTGNVGITVPEDDYTYTIYLKFKDGDYTKEDANLYGFIFIFMIPEKGHLEQHLYLDAKEYKE